MIKNIYQKLLKNIELPAMVRVRQLFNEKSIDDVETYVKKEMSRINFKRKINPGERVAITAGSRGISCIALILRQVADIIKGIGAKPFIVTAMGSHGGGTSQGQRALLSELGIDEETVAVPIISEMDVVMMGKTKNEIKVYFDRAAYSADKIIVINRIKPHTCMTYTMGSGLQKMMAIGLGKQKGCNYIHSRAENDEDLYNIIGDVSEYIINNTPIAACLGIVENAFHKPAVIMAMKAEEVKEKESRLLEISKKLFPRLPFREIDVLVVDEIGKEISGAGLDLIVIGNKNYRSDINEIPKIKRLVVLDLSEKSSGNANGIGLADITTQKLVNKINYETTYINLLSSGDIEPAKIPIIMSNDKDAIKAAIFTLKNKDKKKVTLVRIKNTLQLYDFYVSEALIQEVINNPILETIGELGDIRFTRSGNIAREKEAFHQNIGKL